METDAGTPCSEQGGVLCNGAGSCVPCLTTPDCNDGSLICQSQQCVPAGCANTQRDGNETDVDCGGDCAPCTDGSGCEVADDCASGYCGPNAAGSGGAGGGGGGAASASGTCLPCGHNSDCVGPQQYCDAGVCSPTKLDGDACSDQGACTSGHCVDGVCCDSACGTKCVACIGSKTGGTTGQCLPIPNDQDPDNECVLSCNGSGDCQVL